ncbi:MAG: methyltransferase family protein [Candidatus Thorarchaeota archaeon SMTZ1-45]|nr:MAG: hypothetical protein AM325_14235 [Candidatus Thorarchaeota archaeon SMTZ1-45]
MEEFKEESLRARFIIVIVPNLIFFVTLIISILLVLQLSLPWFLFLGMELLQLPRLIELIVGQVFVILCVGLEAWGVTSISMNRAQGSDIGVKGSSLVTTGAYSYCRHPITLGFAFGTPGFGLVFDFVPLLINSVLFIPIMIALLIYEERELLNRFGNEYMVYKQRVPLLIPRKRIS